MTTALSKDRLLPRAFVASLALHLVAVALIPPLLVAGGTQPVETLSFVRIVQLTVRHPTPHPAAAVVAEAPAHAVVAHAAPVRIPDRTHAHRKAQVRPASPLPKAPVVAAVVHPGTAAIVGKDDAPAIAASAAPPVPDDQNPPNHPVTGGVMPLGADEPMPVLEPSVRQALLALGVHVTLTVDVDAHGRTKSVAFAPPLDAAMQERIRAMLASASWDPAVCGAGMACEANATIRL